MNILGVGAGEALLVLVITLIVVGPNRFPEIARQSGRWYRIARRYTAEVMRDVRAAVDDLEQEVMEEGEDLRSVREIGEEFRSDLRRTSVDLDRIGRETGEELDGDERPEAVPPIEAHDAAEADRAGSDEDAAADPAAASGQPKNGSSEPRPRPAAAPQRSQPSVRPSRRRRSADPFEALEAKRRRERAGDDDPSQ